jgi:ethanolamine utilization protein EutQ (cupin superfamily)
MSGFVLYLLSLGTSVFGLKKALQNFKQTRYLAAAGFLLIALSSGIFYLVNKSEISFASTEYTTAKNYESNRPMGFGKGIHPGRVVWAYNPDATNENCTNTVNEDLYFDDQDDAWFQDKNNNQEVIDQMVSRAIKKLAGKKSGSESWDAMFRHFNQKKGRGEVGYQEGEKVLIKINRTSAWGEPGDHGKYHEDLSRNDNGWHPLIAETSPHVVLAVLKELVNKAGVSQSDIYVGDPMKQVYKEDYELWHDVFPDVNYLGNDMLSNYSSIDLENLDRTPVSRDGENYIYYSDQGDVVEYGVDELYSIFSEADYMINIPTLKAHARAGITLGAKNHFGSHTRGDASHLHPGLVAAENDQPTRTEYGMYRVLTDIMGHKDLGKNTMLVLVDGLWPSNESVNHPEKWDMAPFNGDWASSVFASMDQVAIESVCFDFLRTEYNGPETEDNRPNMGAVDDYLEQAADPDNWPEDIQYDPENDGEVITSLGTHEHWNNSTLMQYSRNLGYNTGIELISIPEGRVRNAVKAKETLDIPNFDGEKTDECWSEVDWHEINQTWIEYGEEVDSSDFYGRYKVRWSSEENRLYFLVEITDDQFVDGYNYPDDGYPNYDIVEVFIDEDHSGGLHVFDNSDNLGDNAENAFSYHIVPDRQPADGDTVKSFVVCDIDGTSWGDKTIPNYAGHFPDFTLKRNGNKYIWEFSMKVYKDTYDASDPEASLAELVGDKMMGMSVAYCDNDTPNTDRDNFFGSVWVPEANYNDHWKNADWYGTLKLTYGPQSENHAPEVLNSIEDLYIEETNKTYLIEGDIHTLFHDPDEDTLNYEVTSDNAEVLPYIEDNGLFAEVKENFADSAKITLTASDGEQDTSIYFKIRYGLDKAPVSRITKKEYTIDSLNKVYTLLSLDTVFVDEDSENLEYGVNSLDDRLKVTLGSDKPVVEVEAAERFEDPVLVELSADDGSTVVKDSIKVRLKEQTGIYNPTVLENVRCYPIPPAGGRFHVEMSGDQTGTVHYQIVSLNGQLMRQGHFRKGSAFFRKTLQVDDLDEGMYILELRLNNKVKRVKFVK